MAIYGTYRQDGTRFTITGVSSDSDDSDPIFTYEWSCDNRNWGFTVDFDRTGATVSDAHRSDTGNVYVKVTEARERSNYKTFGGAVDTRDFPA